MSPSIAQARDQAKVALTRSPRAYAVMRRVYASVRFWMRRPHEVEYAAFGFFSERAGTFLDVGANSGMSALSFRIYNQRSPIVSVEPNPFHEPDLKFAGKLLRRADYRYVIAAAGETEDELTLNVPVYRGVPLTTEASLLHDEVTGSGSLRARLGSAMDGPDFEVATRSVRVRRLDSLGLAPDFIKLDVQGFELQALRGLTETLERSRPVLLVELPDEDVRAFLADHGYAPHHVRGGQLIAGDAETVNTLFLHAADPAAASVR